MTTFRTWMEQEHIEALGNDKHLRMKLNGLCWNQASEGVVIGGPLNGSDISELLELEIFAMLQHWRCHINSPVNGTKCIVPSLNYFLVVDVHLLRRSKTERGGFSLLQDTPSQVLADRSPVQRLVDTVVQAPSPSSTLGRRRRP